LRQLQSILSCRFETPHCLLGRDSSARLHGIIDELKRIEPAATGTCPRPNIGSDGEESGLRQLIGNGAYPIVDAGTVLHHNHRAYFSLNRGIFDPGVELDFAHRDVHEFFAEFRMGQGRLGSVEIGREVRPLLVIAGVVSGLSRLSDLSGFADGFRQLGQVHRVLILNSPRGENWVIVRGHSDERQRRREAFIAECEFACRGNGSRLKK
jgi:hypothetical protein